MTDQNAQEPTMEEILASIRRIISEDDAPAETAAAPVAPEPEPEPAPEPVVVEPEPVIAAAPVEEPAVEEDVLELTQTYDPEPAAETIGDLDVSEAQPDPFPAVSETRYEPEPVEPEYIAPASDEGLVGAAAAGAAATSFAGLASTIRRPAEIETGTGVGPTVDELARALLKPMLKEWLDENLPGIVEAQVRREVERIARNAG